MATERVGRVARRKAGDDDAFSVAQSLQGPRSPRLAQQLLERRGFLAEGLPHTPLRRAQRGLHRAGPRMSQNEPRRRRRRGRL